MQDQMMDVLRGIASLLDVPVLAIHTRDDVLAKIHDAIIKLSARMEAVRDARDALGLAAQRAFFGDEKGHRAALANAHQILTDVTA